MRSISLFLCMSLSAVSLPVLCQQVIPIWGDELHLFARGGHGFGAGRDYDGTGQWLDLAANWLDRLGAQQEN